MTSFPYTSSSRNACPAVSGNIMENNKIIPEMNQKNTHNMRSVAFMICMLITPCYGGSRSLLLKRADNCHYRL